MISSFIKKAIVVIGITFFGFSAAIAQPILYGTTAQGGALGYGSIYTYDVATNSVNVVHDFDFTNGGSGYSELHYANNGLFYGVRLDGSTGPVLFSFDPLTSTYNVEASFGASAYGGVMQASNGNLYGMTANGGVNGSGSIYKYEIATSTLTTIHSFNGMDGQPVYERLVEAPNGKLYASTIFGGADSDGALIELDLTSEVFSIVHNFNLSLDGSRPSKIMLASNGLIYGQTLSGGAFGFGIIYTLDPATNTFTKIHDMDDLADGRFFESNSFVEVGGYLYSTPQGGGATNNGTIVKLELSTGALTKLFDFDGGTNGSLSYAGLRLASNGLLYGANSSGGLNGAGVIYSIDPATDAFALLHDLDPAVEGGFSVWGGALTEAAAACAPVTFTGCPSNISVNNVPTNCGRVVNYTLPIYDAPCGGDVLTQTDASGLTSGDLFPVGITTQEWTVTDANGNTDVCTFTVEVIDNEAPVITSCPSNITVNNDPGLCSAVVSWAQPTASDNCPGVFMAPVPQGPGTAFPVGVTPITYTAVDASGNTATCSFTITVIDNEAPIITDCTPDVLVSNDAGDCGAIVTFSPPTYTENCTMGTEVASQASGTFFPVGTTVVTWTLTDNAGNVETCDFDVVVEDTEAPIATCSNSNVQLNAAGLASIVAADIDGGSIDNCGIASLSASQTNFDCTDVGANTVTLTVTDVNGNVSTCDATVTIIDSIAPLATCQNITVQLDASGAASIIPDDIDGGSTDACGIASLAASTTSFGCGDVGVNVVTLTVTDNNGNISTCTSNVTVEDTISPVAVCQDITVQLDPTGNASITTADIDNGSSDACGIATLALDVTSFDCTNVGANTVTLTVTDNNGNTSECTSTVTVVDTIAPTAICQNVTVQLDPTGSASITTADIDGGSTDVCGIASLVLDVTSFDCSNVGPNTVTLTVTDNNGNISTCTSTVTVQDTVAPTAICQNITVQLDATGNAVIATGDINNGSSDACGIASLVLDETSFDCSDIGNNSVVLTVTDNNGNISTCTATVTVEDTLAPIVVCNDITVQLDPTGNATITELDIDGGSSDNCGIASTTIDVSSFDCSNVGANSVVLTVTDVNGNVATCTATVTVADTVAPVAICQNITVQLNAAGTASITANAIDNGSNDACGIASLSASQTTFDCTNVGNNTVTLTVTDNNGNISTCDATVTVIDSIAPTAICQDIIVQLDATGNVSILPSQVDNGSSDACGIASLALDITDFTCAEVGSNPVVLTVTDNNGNIATCSANVIVQDVTAPTAVCQDITVQLSPAGTVSITGAQIDGGSSDACGISNVIATPNAFTCADVGVNVVTLTVVDNNGNSSTCTANVLVQDTVAPVAVCQNITVQLDPSGNASITAMQVDGGSSDNCAIASMSVSPNAFTCAEVGVNTVTLTVTDTYGNISTCTADVTVEDNVAPTVVCSDITVQLDAGGNGSITAADIDGGSFDACGIASLTADITSFDCSNVGSNNVTLTVVDVNGNSSTCVANVTVEDNVAPAAVCQNITVQLDATGNATITPAEVDNGSNDACGIASLALDITDFTCADIGANTVALTVTDNNGNVTVCTSTVTVADTVAPAAICQNITVQLDPTGNTSITAGDIDNGSNDACGIASLALDVTTFNCSNVGPNTVTLTVTDNNGNSSTCTATVTVEDNFAPITICQDITVQLDATGNYAMTASEIDGGSTDACGIASLVVSDSSFNCSDVGANTVTLTVTDNNGNVSTCTSTVTVIDSIAPVANCQNITVQLDATGNATITPAQIDNGSSDACGIASTTIDVATFDCSNIGPNTVILTVTDNNGNVSTCTSTVTVQDTVAPVATCQNITVLLDATGNASITPAQIDNGSSDACGVASVGLDVTTFDCSSVGPNTVTLTVTDNNGNSSTCTATVTVEDNVVPTAICQDITVQLDAAGNYTMAASEIDGGSTDACGIASLSADATNFDCSDVGANTVILTVTDNNGNVSTCTATVTVEDTVAPTAICQNITVQLDATGNATITPAQIDNGSSDACGIASTTIDVAAFDCSNVGPNTVTLTVTDNNGNSSTCTSIVTVEDNEAPIAICQDITVQLDATGNATITTGDIDNGSNDACGIASVALNVTTFDCSNVGPNTVTLTVTDNNGNSSACTATVTVEDVEIPVISCPSDTTVVTDAGTCGAVVVLNAPVVSDNCGTTVTNNAPATFPLGTTSVTWTVTDASGNAATCVQTVTVEDNELPTITCPADIVVNTDPGVCVASNVVLGAPVTGDNCGVASTSNDAPLFFPLGNTTVTWTVVDNSGNTATCTQLVTVEDNEAPLVQCPIDIVENIAPNACGRVVHYPTPIALDNCAPVIMTQIDGTGYTSGSVFPVGTTIQTFEGVDGSGNTFTCSFTVTIVDNEPPTLSNCPNNITVYSTDAQCEVPVFWSLPLASDNCPGTTLSSTHPNGANFPVGTTTVVYTAGDQGGNLVSCSFTVTVIDTIAPVGPASMPDVISSCEVTLTPPTATDNCGGTITATTTTSFPITTVGITGVVWSFNDGNGNFSSVVQFVDIDGSVNTTVSILDDITLQANNTEPGVSYQWVACPLFEPVPGATDQTFQATVNGSYAVIITEGDCPPDTSFCYSINQVGLEDVTMDEMVVYPNPSIDGQFNIDYNGQIEKIEVIDMVGRYLTVPIENNNTYVDGSALATGKYMLRIYTEYGVQGKEIVIINK